MCYKSMVTDLVNATNLSPFHHSTHHSAFLNHCGCLIVLFHICAHEFLWFSQIVHMGVGACHCFCYFYSFLASCLCFGKRAFGMSDTQGKKGRWISYRLSSCLNIIFSFLFTSDPPAPVLSSYPSLWQKLCRWLTRSIQGQKRGKILNVGVMARTSIGRIERLVGKRVSQPMLSLSSTL